MQHRSGKSHHLWMMDHFLWKQLGVFLCSVAGKHTAMFLLKSPWLPRCGAYLGLLPARHLTWLSIFPISHPSNLLDVFLVLAQLKWRVHDPGAVMKKVVLFAQDWVHPLVNSQMWRIHREPANFKKRYLVSKKLDGEDGELLRNIRNNHNS